MNTADLVDMDHIDDDLARFQQDSIVKDALSKNVDLSQYSRQIDEDLRDVEADSVRGIIQEGDQVVRLLHSPHPQPCCYVLCLNPLYHALSHIARKCLAPEELPHVLEVLRAASIQWAGMLDPTHARSAWLKSSVLHALAHSRSLPHPPTRSTRTSGYALLPLALPLAGDTLQADRELRHDPAKDAGHAARVPDRLGWDQQRDQEPPGLEQLHEHKVA